MRYIKYILLSIIVAAVLVFVGVDSIKKQYSIEVKQSSFTLTDFDYIVNNPYNEKLAEIDSSDAVKAVFPCYSYKSKIVGKTSHDFFILFSDNFDNYEISFFNNKTLLRGSFDPEGIMLDETAANSIKVDVGDTVSFVILNSRKELKVSGIYMASTYTSMSGGLGLAYFSPEMRTKADESYAYTHYNTVFVDANDTAACEALFDGYVDYFDSQEIYVAKTKQNEECPLYTSEEEWTEQIVNQYLEAKARHDALNYSKSIERKAEVMKDVEDQVQTTRNALNSRSVAIAIASFVVYTALCLLFAAGSKKEDLRKYREGIPKNKIFAGDIAVTSACTILIAVVTAVWLAVYSSKQIVASASYTGITLFFSLPVLANLALYIPFDKVRTEHNYNKFGKGGSNSKLIGGAKVAAARVGKTSLVIVLALIFVFLINFYFSTTLTNAVSVVDRLGKSSNTEVVFTATATGNECFTSFNGKVFLLNDESKSINADVFMVNNNIKYKDNVLGYDGTLKAGTCRVSANLMKDYGLSKGDILKVRDSEYTFEIGEPLVAQKGIDTQYQHDGVIIIANSAQMIDEIDHNYVSFYNKVDEYPNLQRRILLKESYAANFNTTLKTIVYEILLITAVLIVLELLLGRSSRVHYRRLKEDGVTNGKIGLTIFGDFIIKYLLPLIAVSAGFFSKFTPFGVVYFIPLFIIWAYTLVLLVAATIVYYVSIPKWTNK